MYLPKTERGLSTFPDVDGGPLVEGYAVGDGEYDNGLSVWNGGADRDGRIVLSAGDTELLDASHQYPPNGYLTVLFESAADYTVEVGLGDVDHSVSIPAEQFDCNDWTVEVAMREETSEERTISTSMACE